MKKRYGILILGTFACAACFLLSACAGSAAEQSSVQPPYDGQTQDADVFIDNLDENEVWELGNVSEKHVENGISFVFCTYINKNPQSHFEQKTL